MKRSFLPSLHLSSSVWVCLLRQMLLMVPRWQPQFRVPVAVARFLGVLGENVGEKGTAQSPSAWWLSSSVDRAGADIWRAAAVDRLSIV